MLYGGKNPFHSTWLLGKLARFVRWCEDGTLGEFSIELMREYVVYLQTVPKYEGHPFHTVNGDNMSAANVRNHVRVMKGFSTWLYEEKYTKENVLRRLKVPKGIKKIMTTLSDGEIGALFSAVDHNTCGGSRNAAIVLLFLDTGLRYSEMLNLKVANVHIEDQWLKVLGKGGKERIVPFGAELSKVLHRYYHCFRPDPLGNDLVFLRYDGAPLKENTIRLIFGRLRKKAGISRLHIHLLRHTFATRYLMNGGDVFSLQRILGHTTLEMTRRYVDMVAVETEIKEKRLSAMDRFLADM